MYSTGVALGANDSAAVFRNANRFREGLISVSKEFLPFTDRFFAIRSYTYVYLAPPFSLLEMRPEQHILRFRGVSKWGFMGHVSKATTELRYLKYNGLNTNDELPCPSVPVL